MRRILILFTFTLLCLGAEAQNLNPADYVYPLLNVRRYYSANFGEIRPGHFHAGVDIKTDNVEGKQIVAVADGYVSRVSVGTYGYGRAIYVTLNNGRTAVYGHLQRFRPDIERRVRQERNEKQTNSVNLWFNSKVWPVKQGEVIGYSGNSGSSGGPHLHFELRDTPTQRLYNVVSEGVICPKDDLPPTIFQIHYIEVDTLRGVPVHRAPRSYEAEQVSKGVYRLKAQAPLSVGRKGYFVIEATDRRNDVGNSFGLWRVTGSVDGAPYFEYRFDSFLHAQSRYSDAVSYYPLKLTSSHEIIRLTQLEKAPDFLYPVMEERGLIRTEPGQARRIKLEAWDDCHNCSRIEFDIKGSEQTFHAEAPDTATQLSPDTTSIVRLGAEVAANIPAGALYEGAFCTPQRFDAPKATLSLVVLSPAYQILPVTTPLFGTMNVSIRAVVPPDLAPHTTLAARNARGQFVHVGGKYKDGVLSATTRTTGELFIVADTIPPKITPLFAENADLTNVKKLQFKVSDNFAGIDQCTLLIDSKWASCDRFPMQGTLIHEFEGKPTGSTHTVQLRLSDSCGNETVWEGKFKR